MFLQRLAKPIDHPWEALSIENLRTSLIAVHNRQRDLTPS